MTAVAPEKPGKVKAFLRLVMIEHSVFALPFAYLSALVAIDRDGTGRHWLDLVLVTVAMVSGRTFAMAANRILDRRIDALNPRTQNRELVTGAVSVRTAWTGAIVSLVVLILAAGLLNPLCLVLSPLAVIPLVIYPYAKRFTDFPHYVLALAQAVAPVGAWLAITGTFHGSGPAWVLGVAVGLWIGGFDIIYACQDVEVDRRIGVHSTPARFGVPVALHISTVTHVVTFALFVLFGQLVGLGWLWWIGLALTAGGLIYQHVVVTPTDLSKVNRAFFTANGFIGIALFVFAVLDLAVL
ncbi:prenyltransferase [Actinoplanes sp. SE50]|uniref:menaquinone biosynthesis prenyltransferase MqnP n=1 Tax=unclassified Actinoplanes TaxID=2626549 RepID=UPI00023EC018|nr:MULTISPECIES: menaquinone biosynthesis prenyltransferase MqnP [unclassified Actinoplanes]AEV81309.1 prenyltransferase [Actinoplanes sp. SE50/110]ATO79712.1 prenyltransferase [Actinoplanes sp. SE50]SLL97115.1 4-hydroxybenzoate octaprenyltransferase [Actinoplanes sp. SE50/110]